MVESMGAQVAHPGIRREFHHQTVDVVNGQLPAISHGAASRPVPGSKREVPFYRADNFPGLPIDIFNNLACFFSIMHIMTILKSNIDLLFTVLLVYIFIYS